MRVGDPHRNGTRSDRRKAREERERRQTLCDYCSAIRTPGQPHTCVPLEEWRDRGWVRDEAAHRQQATRQGQRL